MKLGYNYGGKLRGSVDLGTDPYTGLPSTCRAPGGFFGPSEGIETQFFVDGENGDDENDGLSWATAVQTIEHAIDLNNATVDWDHTPKRYNAIYVAPAHGNGEYDENLSFPYYCWIIGTGIRGTDTMVAVAPATGSAFAGTMLGCALYNLKLMVKEAGVSVLDIGICNNSLIDSCMFVVDVDDDTTIGIDTENCSHLEVANCSFQYIEGHGFAYGMYFRGGDEKFVNNARIHDNVIFAANTGIWIQNTCTATQTVIQHNKIIAGSIGVDDNQGDSYVIDNFITSLPGDAIDHAGGASHIIGNRVVDDTAATGDWEG